MTRDRLSAAGRVLVRPRTHEVGYSCVPRRRRSRNASQGGWELPNNARYISVHLRPRWTPGTPWKLGRVCPWGWQHNASWLAYGGSERAC